MDEKNFSWQKFAVDTLELWAMWEKVKDEYPEFVKAITAYAEHYPDYAARYEVIENMGEKAGELTAEEVC